jgi:hypothetical protein
MRCGRTPLEPTESALTLAGGLPSATRDLARTALLAGLCAALGYALAGVPNVELLTAAVWTCGLLEGPRRGARIGFVAEALFAGLNPMGITPPPLYAAQVLGMTGVGAAGGAWAPLFRRCGVAAQAGLAAASGFWLTLVWDVLTNLAVWVTVRESASPWALVAGGLSFPFPLAHALGNTLGFALVAPAVWRAVRRRETP